MKIVRLQGELERQQGIYYEYDVQGPPLGEGGMGRVFQGFRITESNHVHTRVAIKEIYDDLPAHAIERARREASVQIENDHLIRMYSFIETTVTDEIKGVNKIRYYVIMELLVGITLEDFLNGQVVTKQGIPIAYAAQLHTIYLQRKEEAVIQIVKAVLSGIMALHDLGYIHRDIDPTNIMITHNGKIKLIDFGICKPIRSPYTPNQYLTQYGAFMGKIHYAAPELVMGYVNLQNETTDIYAVGILFYQLYTGRLPFSGTHLQLHQAQMKQKVPVRLIPHRGIRKIILKATDKDQEKRYASAAEFRVALERLSGQGASHGFDRLDLKTVALYGGICVLLTGAVWIGLTSLSPRVSPLTEAETGPLQPVARVTQQEDHTQPERENPVQPQQESPAQPEKGNLPEISLQEKTAILPDVSLTAVASPPADKATLDISEQSVYLPAAGTIKKVTIYTNRADWKFVANASWYTLEKEKNDLWIMAEANHSTEERHGDLLITAGSLRKTIRLRQEAMEKQEKTSPDVKEDATDPLPAPSEAEPEAAAQPVSVAREKEEPVSSDHFTPLDGQHVDKRSYDIRSNGQSDYLMVLRGTRKSKTRVAAGQAIDLSLPLKNKQTKITICKTGSNGGKAQFYYSATQMKGISCTKEIDEVRQICHLHFSLPSAGEYVIYIKGSSSYFFIGAD